MNIDFNLVSERARHLETVRAALKTEFFGIDGCVDRVIDSIKTWYVLPEIMTRISLCSLWGLTGVGKTALIRSLIKHLDFQTRFVEVQMDGISNGTCGDQTSIRAILQASSIREGEQGIVLLDEFQRFRTIDDHGVDVKVERYADVWMLLSDGCFPNDYTHLHRLEERFLNYEYVDDTLATEQAIDRIVDEENVERKRARGEKPDVKLDDDRQEVYISKFRRWVNLSPKRIEAVKNLDKVFFLDQTDARQLKTALRCPDSVRDIMTWSAEKVRAVVRAAIDSKSNPPINYTKCLMFVSGNLDEAFQMSGDVEDCDTSADIFRDYTEKIGTVEIKKALCRRFKPEQIARLGNNHVIYPSLSAVAYMAVIKRACNQYLDETHKICDIRFTIRDEVYQEIYDNSVYPTQGTRPVFTSVHKMFGYPVSDAILWAAEIGACGVEIGLDISSSSVLFIANDQEKRVKIDLDIRARRAKHSDDFNALVAVHEAGHAIVYAELFKMPPVEIAISIASFKGGYNRFKAEHLSKQELVNRIAVGMGGIVAEELIFGQELRSTGCASDVSKSTALAAQYVRQYAMDGFSSNVTGEMAGEISSNTDVRAANPVVDQLVKDQRASAQTVLTKHRDLLTDLSRHLLKVKKMTGADFEAFIAGRIEGLKPVTDKDVNGDYAARLAKA